MRAKALLLPIALLIALPVSSALAQSADTPKKSDRPDPAARRAQLGFLAGSFTTETTMPPSALAPKGANGKGTSVINWGLDSMFLMINEEGSNSIFGKFMNHGMLGYDQVTDEYSLSMFNNFGDHPSYKGAFSGDTLVLQTHVPMPRRPFDQKLLWYKEGDKLRLVVMNDFGKGYSVALDQTAVKQP